MDFQGGLDNQTFSAALRSEFETRSIFLSSTGITVFQVQVGQLWQISDSEQHQSYVVINAGASLDIHLGQNDRVYLKGITTNLRPNGALLIISAGGRLLFRVKEVKPDAAANRTLIPFQSTAGLPPATGLSAMAEKAGAASTDGAPVSGAYADIQRTYAQALAGIAARHSDLNEIKKTFKVDATSDTAGRVIQTLADLRTQAAVDMPPERRAEMLQNTSMVQLRQELTTAANAGYTRLESWISTIVSDLDQVTANTLAAVANVAPSEEDAAHITQPVRKSEDPLLNVIQGLSKPPSVPPANTLQLPRRVAKSFADNNDSALQVVNAIRPDFKTILPVALANVQVTPASLLEVYALRLKAGVYGSTAPLEPVTDKGIVIGTKEWVLDGILDVGVTVNIDLSGDLIPAASISVVDADGTFSKDITRNDAVGTNADLGLLGRQPTAKHATKFWAMAMAAAPCSRST